MYQFIESIKVEFRKVFLIDLHQKRVENTFLHFGKSCTLNLLEIFKLLNHEEEGLFKLRIEYDLENNFRTQMIPYFISECKDFELVVGDEIDYNYKYLNRNSLNQLKEESSADEVLIVKHNLVTDSSYSNLIFLKDEQWFTPKSYLLNGVQRQQLLLEKRIEEIEISLDTITNFSHFKLINALNNIDDAVLYSIDQIINLPQKRLDFNLDDLLF